MNKLFYSSNTDHTSLRLAVHFFHSFFCDLVKVFVGEKCKAQHATFMHHVHKKQHWYGASWNAVLALES